MKIIYCINAVSNSGGMERILMQKANYLADVVGYEIVIVTTEQGGLKPFFQFSPKIRFIDLDVNYGDRADKPERNIIWKVIWKNLHKPIHKKRMKDFLMFERPDIVLTLGNNDIGFLPSIQDGSYKIAESHFCYLYKQIAAKNRIVKLVQKYRLRLRKKKLSKFKKFVVLTNEDKKAWGNMPNITVIPNFIPSVPLRNSNCEAKRVIAVGRAEYQKGFDLLIEAWQIVAENFPDWHLDIFGNGDKTELEKMIKDKRLDDFIRLHAATKDIATEYVNSSLFVLSSRYEGLPMVLLEAMSYGLPIVSFECPCGPKDIVKDDFGTLVPNGDIVGLASSLMEWMSNENRRIKGGKTARKFALCYTQEKVMKEWVSLLRNLTDNEGDSFYN